MSDKYWHEVSRSRFPWEQEALSFLREHLPDHEPWRAWSNFEFIADDGSVNEIDVLVLSKNGLFLVEIKGHQGTVSGDQGTLVFRSESGSRATIDHPLYLTNLKAKRLKSLLQATKAFRKQSLPFIEPLVFLSHASGSQLEAPADSHVVLRDREATDDRKGRAGIVAALKDRTAPGLRERPSVYGDRPLAKALQRALDEIGIARIQGKRRVKDYELREVLEETQVSRDELGEHVSLPKTYRRVRRYFVPKHGELDKSQIVRAAEREFQLLERLKHPGILGALDYTVDELGPVLFLEHVGGAVRLDHYLHESASELDLEARLALLRDIAEAVKYAHAQQVVHRCLSPQNILVVVGKDGRPAGVRIMNWSGGVRGHGESTASSVITATLHPEAYQEQATSIYLAPELRWHPDTSDGTLDVFSLGAIAFHVFAGHAPAGNADELYDKLEGGGLQLSASEEGALESVEMLVADATHPKVDRRMQSVDDLLAGLDAVEEEITRPDNDARCEIPPEAVAGSRFPDGTLVVRRLGSGSTAVAFLVQRGEADDAEQFVLKVARSPEHSTRLEVEAKIVRQLDHPHITRFADDFEVGPYRGLLTKPANHQTLRQRLQADGALQLEMLERFGGQLLEAVCYLEKVGISHRDIKPDNIAISDFEQKKAYGVVLFDFSLSDAPVDQRNVGTPAYSDPFLRDRQRWDLDAERFSAAMTLHEMATGVLPHWGDGRSDPRATEGEVALDGNRFPGGVRDDLLAFFQQALARDAKARFDNADAMLAAWTRAFRATQHTPEIDAPEDAADDLDARLEAQGRKTPLVELPFSTRAANALDRLELYTVEHLLQTPPGRLFRARGVGSKTRGELESMTRELRRRYPDVEITAQAEAPEAETHAEAVTPAQAFLGVSVDELFSLVRSGDKKDTQADRDVQEALLGVEDDPSHALSAPTQTEASSGLTFSRQRFHQLLARLRTRWAGRPPVAAVRGDVDRCLERHHGVMTLREAAESLLAQRGSMRDGDAALGAAAALIRVASEAEVTADEPRWHMRRRGERVWLARSDDHVRYAEELARRAEPLANTQPLPGREAVEADLAQVARPSTVPVIPPGRLVRLAAAACPDVAVSGRGELYPVGLEAGQALSLSVGALLGAGKVDPSDPSRRVVTIDEIRDRVRSRYPRCADLPDRPALDGLLQQAGWDVEWSESHAAYRSRVGDARSLESASSAPRRFPTRTPSPEPVGADELAAQNFEQLVENTIHARRFLVLKTAPRTFEQAVSELAHRFPTLEFVDLDVAIAEALDAVLVRRRIRPELFYEAERAGPSEPVGWGRVKVVMADVAQQIAGELGSNTSPVCIRNVGLLARFELWNVLEDLNGAMSGRETRACLVLIPSGNLSHAAPEIDGTQVPILPGQSTVIPDEWLMNLHRTSN